MEETQYDVVMRLVKKLVEVGIGIGEPVFNSGVQFEQVTTEIFDITVDEVMETLPKEQADKVDHLVLTPAPGVGRELDRLIVDIYYK